MKTTILISIMLSVLVTMRIPCSNAATMKVEDTSCSDLLTMCTFTGTCCSLSDLDDTGQGAGCMLTTLGGTCNTSGANCNKKVEFEIPAGTCPSSDYNVTLADPASADGPNSMDTSSTGNRVLVSHHGFLQYVGVGVLITPFFFFNHAI